MQFEHKSIPQFELLIVEGRLDTHTSDKLDEKVEELRQSGCTNFLFDLRNLEYISSYGIRIFAKLLRKSCRISMVITDENVMEIVQMSGLPQLIQLTEDITEAITGLSKTK
jgi:anti-anti-sigma factor